MRFRGIVYRAHNPQWSWTPLSGEGARRRGGRLNRRGVPALYMIALELMVRGRLRVREIPIDFRDRSVGTSRMNWHQQVRFARHLSRLYNFKLGTLTRVPLFSAVGGRGAPPGAGPRTDDS